MRLLLILMLSFCSDLSSIPLKNFEFKNDPIDVVILCAEKDVETLDLCIEGVKKNCKDVRRVIVVSPIHFTQKAEWFDEKKYPFSKNDIAVQIFKNEEIARSFNPPVSAMGWIYQQFLKLYAPLVIPSISTNVLIVDAETIFLNPVEFLSADGAGLYNSATENVKGYNDHMNRLVPGLKKRAPPMGGISHHMLFQKCVIEDLFQTIEEQHKTEAWKAICNCIDRNDMFNALSEYEIYFNYVLARTNQCKIRDLKWDSVASITNLASYQQTGYHFVTAHYHLRH